MEEATAAGEVRSDINARRTAAMTMQTVMFIAAQSSADAEDGRLHPITADEVWDFCAHGFVLS